MHITNTDRYNTIQLNSHRMTIELTLHTPQNKLKTKVNIINFMRGVSAGLLCSTALVAAIGIVCNKQADVFVLLD